MSYPLRHISIRVPWHDTAWDGRVCAAPRLNGACVKLKGIAEKRDDDAEESVAGSSIRDLPQAKWPSCIVERAGFMAPFEYVREADHPYNRGPDTIHGHFKRTPLRHPPYAAAAVPFAWMLRESMEALAEDYELDVQAEPFARPRASCRGRGISACSGSMRGSANCGRREALAPDSARRCPRLDCSSAPSSVMCSPRRRATTWTPGRSSTRCLLLPRNTCQNHWPRVSAERCAGSGPGYPMSGGVAQARQPLRNHSGTGHQTLCAGGARKGWDRHPRRCHPRQPVPAL